MFAALIMKSSLLNSHDFENGFDQELAIEQHWRTVRLKSIFVGFDIILSHTAWPVFIGLFEYTFQHFQIHSTNGQFRKDGTLKEKPIPESNNLKKYMCMHSGPSLKAHYLETTPI